MSEENESDGAPAFYVLEAHPEVSRLLKLLAQAEKAPAQIYIEDGATDILAGVLADITERYLQARFKHPPWTSEHHGYAVILEELDEAWDEIKGDTGQAGCEIVDVGAAVVRFIIDLVENEGYSAPHWIPERNQ